jgi:peptide/nickel transport system ATP-binding protein
MLDAPAESATLDLPPPDAAPGEPLVTVEDLRVRLVNRDMNLPVLQGVSFTLREG